MKKIMIYMFLICFLLLSTIFYMYLNPSIDNIDFDLEYKISNGKKNYDEARNSNYVDNDYTFNHLHYCNDLDAIKLIIHSLDKKSDGKERVVFVVKDATEKYPTATIDYFKKNKSFNIFRIKYKGDSILLWKKPSLVQEKEEPFFKGKRCK